MQEIFLEMDYMMEALKNPIRLNVLRILSHLHKAFAMEINMKERILS